MSIDVYRNLINQICAHAQIPDPRALYDKAELDIGGTQFMLRHGGDQAPHIFNIYCGLGPLPETSRELAMQRLLETNLLMASSGTSACFGYNPDNKQAILYCVMPLDQSSGLLTLSMLRQFAAVAEQWRNTYFLDQNEIAGASDGRAASSGGRARLDAQLRQAGAGTESIRS